MCRASKTRRVITASLAPSPFGKAPHLPHVSNNDLIMDPHVEQITYRDIRLTEALHFGIFHRPTFSLYRHQQQQ